MDIIDCGRLWVGAGSKTVIRMSRSALKLALLLLILILLMFLDFNLLVLPGAIGQNDTKGVANPISVNDPVNGQASISTSSLLVQDKYVGVTDHVQPYLNPESIRASGIAWIRTDVNFWPGFSQFLSNLSGENFIGILDYETMGVVSSSSYPGNCVLNCNWTLSDWAGNVSEAVNDYPQIHAWEIWNEPQIQHYQSGYLNGNPLTYFNMLKAAYEIIKSHNSTDTVLCLGGDNIYYWGYSSQYLPDLQWADQLWSYGAGNYCNGISLHAYTGSTYLLSEIPTDWTGNRINETIQQIFSQALNSYETLTGKPIWITETGIPSNNSLEMPTPAVYPTLNNSVARQSLFLTQAFTFFLSQSDVKAVFWYNLIGVNPPYQSDFGLFSLQGNPKPALNAFESFEAD